VSRFRRVLAVALSGTLLLGVAACSESGRTAGEQDPSAQADAGPRALTSEEAQRLSMMRFRNFSAGERAVQFSVEQSGTTFAVSGWFDFHACLGYGLLTAPSQSWLIGWTDEQISSVAWDPGQSAPLPVPTNIRWEPAPLQPDDQLVEAVLGLLCALSADRPGNSLILAQSDARWLESKAADGVQLDIIAGPTSDEAAGSADAEDTGGATTRYAIDQTGLLHHVDLRLGSAAEWTRVSLSAADEDVAFEKNDLGLG